VSHATEIGVTGTIQRYHHFDVVVYVEGLLQQLQMFFDFLAGCMRDGMFTNIERSPHQTILFRLRVDFSIVTDHSKTVKKGGKVEKGPHSDDDHEKNSVSSAGSGVFLGYQPQHVSK
jgi:hypothetical protein